MDEDASKQKIFMLWYLDVWCTSHYSFVIKRGRFIIITLHTEICAKYYVQKKDWFCQGNQIAVDGEDSWYWLGIEYEWSRHFRQMQRANQGVGRKYLPCIWQLEVCVCICVCMYVTHAFCVYIVYKYNCSCVQVWSCMWRSEDNLGCHFSPSTFFETDPLPFTAL